MKKLVFIFLIMLCWAGKALCFPVLTGRVVDDADILTYTQKEELEQLLEQAEPHQVVAVSLQSLDGQEIEEYGYQLGRHWGIGRRDINDGVLVLIAPNQRQLRIEVGYGLEGTLTDALCSRIVNRIMLPLAKEGKYDEALIQGSKAVLDTLLGKTSETLSPKVPEGNISYICILLGLILVWIVRLTVPNYIYNLFKKNNGKIEKTQFSAQEEKEIHKNKIHYIFSLIPVIIFYSIFLLLALAFFFMMQIGCLELLGFCFLFFIHLSLFQSVFLVTSKKSHILQMNNMPNLKKLIMAVD